MPLAMLVITDMTAGNGFGEVGLESAERGYPGNQGGAVRGVSGKKLGAGPGLGGKLGAPFPCHCTHSLA